MPVPFHVMSRAYGGTSSDVISVSLSQEKKFSITAISVTFMSIPVQPSMKHL